ncbi:GNAT Acetyltransferase, toxin component [Bifidobacterium lemurum]|uniref:GNAT Acetyltransferase, toxin component n=1 Tax=Bifidobacterium lemurum TaxID=1603886 RepID=A0A261FMX4_9BIFI|nr:GNAT family N-acetyltransferase [Bifidobacterium lemurum]OZG60504.1 GNAT Acetyltransferase, toxin component [Bifidobacterium lemurum]QOL34476.1 GNAT family N-acetyltransferase [Bifidobacterium lemurum]
MNEFLPPRRLEENDDIAGFESGLPVVDDWLHNRGLRAQRNGTAVVYASWEKNGPLAGFYTLGAYSVSRDEISGGWMRRNAPKRVPVILLGMLGVDIRYQRSGIGKHLLRDAILRASSAASVIGAKALIVEPAGGSDPFYRKYGFQEIPGTGYLYVKLER